ncbi:uncharacterized protein LOC111118215 [Crassostrea virginica]|uniref:Uncharacterized protein LOC111118215 n=1 Tax=Crassostrea virginica TaxID=6565 RepID=A0A8B8CFD1_CRAVI|nr:uncharacterized protein LOC111118215 [Crassostrea virginica]
MSNESGAKKQYGPVKNPYANTLRNYFEYLKKERRIELKFQASNNPGITIMLFASFGLMFSLYPLLKLHERINFVERAYHGHYRVKRREDADPKLQELGYYN